MLIECTADILRTMYQSEPPPKLADADNQRLVRRLETFYKSLPPRCQELQRLWTARSTVLSKGDPTSSQGKFELEEIIDTAYVMLEYYVSSDDPLLDLRV